MTLDARLTSAADALDSLPASREDIGVVRRRSRRRRFVATVVAVVIVAAGVGLLRTNSSDASRSVYAGPSQGGEPVDYHGLTVDLPATWQVIESTCAGQDRTMLVGELSDSGVCVAPDPNAGWIWLRPIADFSDDDVLRSCTPGFIDNLPTCQSIDPTTMVETLFIDGLDVALVRHTTPRDADFTSASPYRYTDSARPEAQVSLGPPISGPSGYQLEQPLTVAQDAVQAWLDGDCARFRALADETYTGGCPDGIKGAKVGGSQATSAGGAVSTQSARVTATPALAFDVDLQHEWSRTTKRGEWRIVSVTSIDPATPLPSPTEGQPACTGVVDHSGRVVGCARTADLHPRDPTRNSCRHDRRRCPGLRQRRQRPGRRVHR